MNLNPVKKIPMGPSVSELECWDCGDLIAACQCGETIHCSSLGAIATFRAAALHDEAVSHGYAAQAKMERQREERQRYERAVERQSPQSRLMRATGIDVFPNSPEWANSREAANIEKRALYGIRGLER